MHLLDQYQVYFLGVKAAGASGWPYHHPVPLSWNLGTFTSWNPMGHSRPATGLLTFYLFTWSVTLVHCIIISERPPRIFLLPYVLHEGQAVLNLAGPSVLTFLWFSVFVTLLLLHCVKQISKWRVSFNYCLTILKCECSLYMHLLRQ
jgi:hypothetical protein